MNEKGKELDKIQNDGRQPSQVINADIVFFAGLLQFKDGAKESVLDRVNEFLQGRLFCSQACHSL